MSRSRTTIDEDWLLNPYAGDILWSEFMEPLGLDTAALGESVGVVPDRIGKLVEGAVRVDAELDLRLARYFGMSEGFFLRLQDGYELCKVKRALDGELDRIVPHAA